MSRDRAYNAPPADYVPPPAPRYVVVMRRGDEELRSALLNGSEVDAWVGHQHRGFGWQFDRMERVT